MIMIFSRLCRFILKINLFGLIGVFLLLFSMAPESIARDKQSVLYISSYHPGFPTFFQQIDGIKSVFGHNILLDIEFMDTKRYPQKEGWELFQKTLSYKLVNSNVYDAIMVADDNALLFALEQQEKLFKGKPIVFLGVNNIDLALNQNNNPGITGVVESVSMEETIDLMIKLRPKSKQIVALVDGTNSGQNDLKLFYQVAEKFSSYHFVDLSLAEMNFQELLISAKRLGEESSVLLLSAYQDKNNKSYSFNESLRQIKESINVPIFHLWYHGLGQGILGGKIISHYEQGEVAANVVLEILSGTPTEQIKVVDVSPNRYIFDYLELDKFNIQQSSLPENSIILNKPKSFYRENRRLVWAATIVIILLFVALLFSVVNIFKRKNVEKNLAQVITDLKDKKEDLELAVIDRKKTQIELKESLEHFHMLFNLLPFSCVINDMRGRILLANKYFCETAHKPLEEITGRTMEDLGRTSDPEQNEKIKSEIKKHGSVSDVETTVYQDNFKTHLLFSSCLIDWKGQKAILSSTVDITKRKKAEEERNKLHGHLAQARKMEAIGTLAGGIAHDFNNILSGLMGFTDLAILEAGDNESLKKYLNQVSASSLRARDLVRHILTFSRKSDSNKQPIAINSIIKETLKFIRASLPASIEIRHDLKIDQKQVLGDSTQIHQILMNLFTNSGHAMKEKGGVLEVTLDTVTLDESQTGYIGKMLPGHYLQLTISDTGYGISKKIIDRIFEPFFTTKEREKGTGMGLATVYGILKEMGGGISVYSEEGVGTSFKILLPEYSQRIASKDEDERELKTGHGNILIIDDETPIVESTSVLLTQLGYSVTGETNGLHAVETVKNNPDFYDLILTDMMMHGIDGLELAKQIREINPKIPIILCTGFSPGLTKEKCESLGIKDMVMKPMIASELSLTVDKTINKKK